MESVSTNDQHIWRAFKGGDSIAFAQLYQNHVKVLYAYGFKLLSDRAVIEDIVQDIFIELWQKRENLADVDSPKFYLFRVLRRRVLKSMVKNSKLFTSIELNENLDLPVTFPKEFYIIEAESIQKQKLQLDQCLKNLPIRQYEVLVLRFYQDLSYSEISEMLSINEQSVRNLIQRGLLKLRQFSIQSLFTTGLVLFFKIIFFK